MKRSALGIKLFLAACAALIICVGAAISGRSQSPTAPATAPAALQNVPAPIVSVSRLVQVNVIVEKKGRPVTGLTKEDFTILDENQPQKISSFAEVAYDPAVAPMRAAASNSSPAAASASAPNNGAGAMVNSYSNHFGG
jgi:hypothetical protein